MKTIRLLLVDDHYIVRMGIKALLERNDGFVVCGEAGDLAEAYKKVQELKPDVVLLDMKLPDGDGVSGCREIKKMCPDIKIIMLTAYAEDSIVMETVRAGADGYLLKNIDSKTIVSAIKNVHSGTSYFDSTVVDKVLRLVKGANEIDSLLSPQEKKILELVSLGRTNKEIGEVLFIAEKTVRNTVSKIMRKINVSNRTEAAIYWSRQMSLK